MLAYFIRDFLISQVENDPKPLIFQQIGHILGIFGLSIGDVEHRNLGRGDPSRQGAGVLFDQLARTQMIHVPYKGGAPAMIALVGGEVNMVFATAETAVPQIKAGKIRALGVTTAKRADNLTDVPTLAEAGIAGYEANSWQMFVGPANMPEPIVARVNAAMADFMQTPEAQKHFVSLGMKPNTGTPAEAGEYIRAEVERWTAILKGIGVSGE